MFEPFTFIIVLVVAVPLAKAVARRIEGGGRGPGRDQVDAMRRMLEASEQRTQDAEQRMHQLEERVDFLERLLQSPREGGKGALPPR